MLLHSCRGTLRARLLITNVTSRFSCLRGRHGLCSLQGTQKEEEDISIARKMYA